MKMEFRSTKIQRTFSFLVLKLLISILSIANAMEESSVDEYSQRRELTHLTPDMCFTTDCTSAGDCEVPYG